MNRTAFITHPDTLLHVMDGQHPESPARITAIRDRLQRDGLLSKLQIHEAPAATDAQLTRVHTPAYVQHIRRIAPKAGLVRLDPDTAMGPMSLSAVLHAAGAAVLATDLVMQGKAHNAFCCVRPPGHHAGRETAAGFCIFNGISVGVAHALAVYGLQRVAIIDFDVHHGDGTEDIFRDDARVMLCSTFQHPFYPGKGADSRSERMINVPLKAETDGSAFRQAVTREFAPALARFKPQMVFVSAGFDAHADDPLAQLGLQRDDYAWVTRFIMEIAASHAQGRVVSVLEGGYRLEALADCATAHVSTLAGL
ncbi:histone deacetylase family protein [Pseudomethylobacillus aquaticus]|uniref:Histone deacetylase family protein n=1 Tax=Pseudomethylobacillus aquaticus TaxID=2676064 RepID=A0A3N0V6N0_9PROT|nr:histone deacetylase family protein [Pseudomethylobacillus aquaticus]ROH88272.1 histone deacetylase family protein [Pseudomethylobacillus aquaticus]